VGEATVHLRDEIETTIERSFEPSLICATQAALYSSVQNVDAVVTLAHAVGALARPVG
jgi:hypothetical protein